MFTTALRAQVGEESALDDEVAAQLRGVTGRLADIMPGVAPVPASVPGLTAAQIERGQGILVRNQRKFQALADAEGLTIDVRPTNEDAVPWLHLGGIPKPPAIKAKTISGLDVQLGADERFKGAVGFFQPVLPPRGSMSDADWNRLVARYEQRMDEQAELGPKMANLATHKVGEDRFEVHEGVVYGYDSGGVLRPVTGDHDMFNIRRQDGSQLSGGEYTNLVNELVDRDMGVQHGAHMYWQPDTDWERTNVYEPIVQQHMPGGKEQLVRFAPGQPPSLVWGDAGV
jgi:hypothetical protein